MYLISWQIMCFGQKTQQQQNRKSNMKILAWTGNRIGTPCTPVGCVTSGPPSQLNVSIVFKQINCFNAMGRYCRLINKAEFAGHTFSTSSLLWRVIKCYPCQSVRAPEIWCPLNNFWKTASIQFKSGMLIYNIKTQIKFNLGYNPLIVDRVMGFFFF